MPLTGKMAILVTSMAGVPDARMAFRLSIIMAGMMVADDRRVAAAWFSAAGVKGQLGMIFLESERVTAGLCFDWLCWLFGDHLRRVIGSAGASPSRVFSVP